MKQEITVKENKSDLLLSDLQDTHKMCQILMQSPHYKKLGSDGIFAIVEKAKSTGVNQMDALNGGFYFVQGKVEMSSSMMNQLIRAAGHSISKDRKSDNTICILHGKRADNGDTWTESFSIEEAKMAGIYRNQWLKYPRDMLFARALSRLARQLFPDVIKGCYVQGEISEAPSLDAPVELQEPAEEIKQNSLSETEAHELNHLIGDDTQYRNCVMNFILKHAGAKELVDMPREVYEKILPVARKKHEARKSEAFEFVNGEEQQMAMEA